MHRPAQVAPALNWATRPTLLGARLFVVKPGFFNRLTTKRRAVTEIGRASGSAKPPARVAPVLVDFAVVATTFALIFPAELPDKTFIATLVLATRYRHLPVWLGVSAAFAVQVTIAVTAGGLLALLPQRLVLGVTATLFVVGAAVLVIGGLKSRAAEFATEQDEQAALEAKVAADGAPSGDEVDVAKATSPWRVFVTSFVILFTAEWGDLSQILTAGLAARTGQPFSVFIGSWVALILVAGIAVLAGRWLQQRVPIWRIRLVSGGILAALAIWTIAEFVRI